MDETQTVGDGVNRTVNFDDFCLIGPLLSNGKCNLLIKVNDHFTVVAQEWPSVCSRLKEKLRAFTAQFVSIQDANEA